MDEKSRDKLATCTDRLQMLFYTVDARYPCNISDGHRSPERQKELFLAGKSKVEFSKHNYMPSRAVDAQPLPVNFGGPLINTDGTLNGENLSALLRFYRFSGYVHGVADVLDVPLRSGDDWDGDQDIDDQTFNDLNHFEII